MHVTDVHPLVIQQHDIEQSGDSVWMSRVHDIEDSGNKAVADITWWSVKTGVGAVNSYTVNGGSGVKYRRLGAVYP